MNIHENLQVTNQSQPGKSSGSNFKSSVSGYLYYWPYFLLAIAVGIGGAYVYLQYARPVYEVMASVQIKDQKKNADGVDQKSLLQELIVSNPSNMVENEIEVLKSMQLIKRVVDQLQLANNYQAKNGFFYQDIYHSSPVLLTIIKNGHRPYYGPVIINIDNERSFTMTTPDGSQEKHLFNATISNVLGNWRLDRTRNFKSFIGEKIKIEIRDPEKVALRYQEIIDVTLVNKLTTSISLSINDQNVQRGKDILNRLIFEYNQSNKSEKDKEIKSTLAFIDQRLALITGQLNNAESNIEGFKSSRGLTDIPSDTKFELENKQSNIASLNEINVQLSIIDGVSRFINSNAGKLPSTIGITDPALSSVIEKLSLLQLQREKMLATLPETNPDFEPLNRQIATARSVLKDNVKNIRQSLLNAKQQLQSNNSGYESAIKSMPVQERQYVSIKRQQSVTENLYLYLLQKREELSLRYASTLANERIVDNAYVGPVKGLAKPLIYITSILIALCLVACIIYIIKSIKNKVINSGDIEEMLPIPIISELNFEDYDRFIPDKNHGTVIDEQFRALRINLHYLHKTSKRGRVTLVTSSVAGEGKSFVCNRLAISVAYSGRKTVVLDLDLRRPQITEVFGLSKDHPGMSDFLKGDVSLEEILQPSGLLQNLKVISHGSVVHNSSELLEKPELQELIERLRQEYDDIIIDSPPLHLVADALIIAPLSDVTLYVIRQGYTGKLELGFIKKLFSQNRISKMNIIFNGIKSAKYGYGYNYNSYYTKPAF